MPGSENLLKKRSLWGRTGRCDLKLYCDIYGKCRYSRYEMNGYIAIIIMYGYITQPYCGVFMVFSGYKSTYQNDPWKDN